MEIAISAESGVSQSSVIKWIHMSFIPKPDESFSLTSSVDCAIVTHEFALVLH